MCGRTGCQGCVGCQMRNADWNSHILSQRRSPVLVAAASTLHRTAAGSGAGLQQQHSCCCCPACRPGTTAMDPPDVMASPSPPSQPPTLLRTVRFKETDIETGLCQSASPPQPQQQPPGTITAQCSGTAGQASDVNSSTTPTQQPAPSSIGLRNLSFVPAGFATPFHDTDSCSSQISYTAPDLQHHHNKDAAVTAVPPGAADSSADCQKQQADVSLPSKGSTLKATKSLQAEFGLQKGQRRYTLRSVGK